MKLNLETRPKNLKKASINTILLSFLYVFMTWLFFVTKPSFMDILNLSEKLGVLFTTGLSLSLLGLFFLIIIFLLDFFITPASTFA